MPRKQLFRSDRFPYHVTGRTNNKENFFCTLPDVWKFLTKQLHVQSESRTAKVHAFVLMPNHYHLLISTPQKDLDKIMQDWVASTTRIMNRRSGRSGHVYGGRYYWSSIQNPHYFSHAYKYLYRNPVKAGLCERVEDYEFSTLRENLGLSPTRIKLCAAESEFQQFISEDLWRQKDWLNRAYSNEDSLAIRNAIRRKIFKFPKNRSTRQEIEIAL